MARSRTSRASRRVLLEDGEELILRNLRPDDLNNLLVYVNTLHEEKTQDRQTQLFTGFEEKYSQDTEAKYLRETLDSVRTGKIINVVAEVNGRIVGNGEIERGPYKETMHYGRLGLTILYGFRGRGIGREMLKVLLTTARREKLKLVQVEFLSTNGAAVRTYRAAGFTKAGRIPGKVARNGRLIDSTIMVARL